MVAKTRASKVNKGRILQKWVRDRLMVFFNLTGNDVRSTSSGSGGIDVQLSERALELFPYNIECKNQERVNLWEAYAQAARHGDREPLVFLKRAHHRPLALVDADYFIGLHGNDPIPDRQTVLNRLLKDIDKLVPVGEPYEIYVLTGNHLHQIK